MAKRDSFANAVWGLPWIVKVLVAIFFDFIFGICRFIDGLCEKNIIKAVIGFLWIFYGLFIGWLLDIVCCLINKRPILF
ncbi:MAG: hypothetical protein K2H43_04715 [Clostridia bacterium]|nr:hypothetical protein [Clostridia bacterium]